MLRRRLTLVTLFAALVPASAASAQVPPSYPLGPLEPGEFVEPPAAVPRGLVGEYP